MRILHTLLFICSFHAIADTPTLLVTKLSPSIYMLTGQGGNIAAHIGEDGILIVDDQYAKMADAIEATLATLSKQPVSYVINTHYHGDHTGSNAHFGKNATIYAHHEVLTRLKSQSKLAKDALPKVTYDNGIRIHINDDTIMVRHLPNGHTDGDSIVHFKQQNILHSGDLFFKDRFPYIDTQAGGTVSGYIQNVKTLINLLDENSTIIPGHGSLANKADYQRFLTMLESTNAEVQALKAAGLTDDQILNKGLSDKWQTWSWRFISEERWIKTLLTN